MEAQINNGGQNRRRKSKNEALEGQEGCKLDNLEPERAFSMMIDLAEGHNDCSQHLNTKSLANRLMRPEKNFALLCAFIIQHIRHRVAFLLYHARFSLH